MKTNLTPGLIAELPIHDSEVIAIRLNTTPSKKASLEMVIEINPDESLEPFTQLGAKLNPVNVHFKGCWQVVSNLLFYLTTSEQILNWEASPNSKLIDNFHDKGLAENVELLYHRFEFSGGSILEILAEEVFVT